MNPSTTPNAVSPRRLKSILTGVANPIRWRIFDELLKGEPLPVKELAKRLKIPVTNTSKHMAQLIRSGLVERTYSRAYRVPAHFLIPGELAIDFGPVLLRLDRVARS